MFDSAFQQGDSFIHKSDPRIRLIAGFLIAFTIALLKSPQASILALFIATCTVCISRLSLRKIFKALFFANMFIGFLWLFIPFSVQGETLLKIWNLAITKEGIKFALLITIKCNAILISIISFIATIPIHTMGYALDSLGVSKRLTLILLMSYRYVNVIFEEYNRLVQALKVRCFKPGTNLHTYKTYAYLIAMVFVRSYERGIRVYQAMLLRGFNGKFYSLRRFKIKASDIALLVVIVLLCSSIFLIDRGIIWLF